MYLVGVSFLLWFVLEESFGTLSGPSHFGVSTFTPVPDRNGSTLCAADPPIGSIYDASLKDCSWKCITFPLCENFNYDNQTQRCDLFFDKASTLVPRPGCAHYQMLKGRPRDCDDILRHGFNRSGIYVIFPLIAPDMSEMKLAVYCDLQTGGRGWIVFQRRVNGTENFYRGWNDYKRGFGNLSNEFWIGCVVGNEILYALTSARRFQLRVDLQDFDQQTRYAEYSTFQVNSAMTNYTLSVGGYVGDAGDCLTQHNRRMFSTIDADNDLNNSSCAIRYHGGWWYHSCHCAELNGDYLRGNTNIFARGVDWYTWRGHYYSLKFAEMKFAPAM